MVKVIQPVGVQAEAPQLRGIDEPDVVQVAFGHQMDPPAEPVGLLVHSLGQVTKKRLGGVIQDGVQGVQPEGVYMALGDPVQSIRPRPRGCGSVR